MDLTSQEQSILKTLAHFDVLDYPLTLLEIAKFNELGLSLAIVDSTIKSAKLSEQLAQNQGFYCLKNRIALIPLRLERYRLSLLKLKRARRFAKILAVLPWIRGIAVYSSLSLKNSRPDSDIDLFFITASGRVWSARFWLNIFLKIFRLRPAPNLSRDKLCASYLVDEANLDLSGANLGQDFYYTYGCANFLFLSASTGLIDAFWQANVWIKQTLPGWQPQQTASLINLTGQRHKFRSLAENLLGLIAEKNYHDWQLRILPKKYLSNNDGKKVTLGSGSIKLHDNDKRNAYNRLFEENYQRLANYAKQT